MIDPLAARELHRARARDIGRRARYGTTRDFLRQQAPNQRSRRSIRRSVGRAVVRVGQAIAAEPRQPVASR